MKAYRRHVWMVEAELDAQKMDSKTLNEIFMYPYAYGAGGVLIQFDISKMSYSQVSHVAHQSYPDQPGPPPPGRMFQAPPPPPRPGFEQGYQGYLSEEYFPPTHFHHTGPTLPYYSNYGNPCSSFLRACFAALCCCYVVEECCPRW